jgi:glycolate oxidase
MNRILEFDRDNLFIVVEAGVTTGDVQKLAREEGYLYAGDPCSAESSFIGGNIATNAGGNKAVKYGSTSKHVYGLEVVLPQGDILNLGGKCVKDVTGYDLIHLIVGSEGTLGIVTKIYLKLLPRPLYNAVLLAPFADMSEAIAVVPKVMKEGGVIPTSIEFMDNLCIKSAEQFLERELPNNDAGAYIIIEVESSTQAQLDRDMEAIADLLINNGAAEVFVGDNPATQERIWRPRRVLAEALRVTSPTCIIEDIVVPMSKIPEMVADIQTIAAQNNIRIACFGHAGDGNIHATLLKEDMTDSEWSGIRDRVLQEIYQVTYARGGTLSGEHGVGAKRKEALAQFIDPVKLNLMVDIKKVFDPNLILNPGKIFEIAAS